MKKVTYKIKQDDINAALQLCTGEDLNDRTISSAGRLSGFLGEIIFARFLSDCEINFGYVGSVNYEYDFIVMGKKIDVKVALRNHPMREDWTIKVPAYRRFQECDAYVHMNHYQDNMEILGYIPKSSFWDSPTATLFKAGEKDPDSRNFIFPVDTQQDSAMTLIDLDKIYYFLSAN